MEITLLVSVLILPVLLLASPIVLFAVKQRSEIGVYYMFSMMAIQFLIVALYWGQFKTANAALWVLGLLGFSLVLGNIFAYLKTRSGQWIKYSTTCVVITGSLLSGAIILG